MADVNLVVTLVDDGTIAIVRDAAQNAWGDTYTDPQLKAKLEEFLAIKLKDFIVARVAGEAASVAQAAAIEDVNITS